MGETGESVLWPRPELLLLLLLMAIPLELLPLCCAMVAASVGRSNDLEAASAAGLEVGLVGTGFRLIAAAASGAVGISRTDGILGLRGPVFGGD